MSQGQLAAFSGVDQSTISRYIEFADIILEEMLPTALKIAAKIKKAITLDELKKIIPNYAIIIDGTHVLIQRSKDKSAQKDMYSGKKKRHIINTTITTNLNGLIVYISKSFAGYTHDNTMVRDGRLDFGILNKMMRNKIP